MNPTPIPFGYPRRGLTGRFATFRLGRAWAERVAPGDTVELVDARTQRPLKRATVLSVHQGTLDAMASLHAAHAHNWRDHPETERPALLQASLAKRYPPGRVKATSVVTVIYLETHDGEQLSGQRAETC